MRMGGLFMDELTTEAIRTLRKAGWNARDIAKVLKQDSWGVQRVTTDFREGKLWEDQRPISRLALSSRVRAALRRAKYTTVGDLLRDAKEGGLAGCIPGIGKTHENEI